MDHSNSSYEICLVIPKDQTQDTVSARLKETYKQLNSNEMGPSWISYNKCLALEKPINSLFVCDPFAGEAYVHLQKIGCRILGPNCLLTCLKDESNLPKRATPVFSLNMRHVVVTFSNIPPQNKKRLRDRVILMGGDCPNSLTQSCTHLVTGCVGSEKYLTAVRLKLPIMTPEWVLTCFSDAQKSETDLRHSTDNFYDTYKCKPFYGLVVTASQLDSKERQKIQSIVTENGGKYSGSMKMQETTHLVLETPNGNKFDYAQSWNVKCVKKAWIKDCVVAGAFLPEDAYELKPDGNIRMNKASTPKKDEQPFQAPNCSILLPTGPKDLVNETCLSNVSFILAPGKVSVKSRGSKNCAEVKKKLAVNDSRYDLPDSCAFPTDNVNSFLKNIDNVRSHCEGASSVDNKESVIEKENEKSAKELEPEEDKTFEKPSTVSDLNSRGDDSKINIFSEMKFVVVDPNPDDHSLLVEMLESHGGTILKSDEPSNKDCVWIVPVVEFECHVAPAGSTVRTNFWVQICVEEQALQPVNMHRLYQPICVASIDSKPLKGCVLAFSQFSVSDKNCLDYLATTLGAQCSEYFVRVENKKKGLLPNTHLILSEAEGNKYEAAIKWGIPAVRKEWLYQAAVECKRPDEELFRIDGPEPNLNQDKEFPHNDISNVSNCISTSRYSSVVEPGEKSLAEDGNKGETSVNTLKGDNWSPGFDVSEAKEMLKSRKRGSIPFEEKVEYHFSQAQKHFGIDSPGPRNTTAASSATPLSGIVLCVSRKLASQQKKLHSVTEKLGGRVLWSYDNSCTHYVHQGKSNDHFGYGIKEFRLAQSQSKFVVCPEWIYACEESQSRVNETDYPYNYNPRLSLSSQITSEKVLSQDERKQDTSVVPLKAKPKSGRLDCSKSSMNDSSSKVRSVSLGDTPTRKNIGSVETTPVADSEVSKKLQALMTVKKHSLISESVQKSSPQKRDYWIEQLKLRPQSNLEPETQPSQNVQIMWEDPTEKKERESLAKNPVPLPPDTEPLEPEVDQNSDNDDNFMDAPTQKAPRKKVFLLSGLQEEMKLRIHEIIERLEGTVVDSFNVQVTHLVCETPTKNEKILSSIAAGIWILHPSFIQASERASRFVSEDEFEWGSDFLKPKMQKLLSKVQKVGLAAHVWRKRVADTCKKAFHNWEVKLFVPQQRLAAYSCILKAGGAEIVDEFTPGYSLARYAFLEGQFVADVSELELEGVTCAKPEYFSAILVENPVPSATLYAVKGSSDQQNNSLSNKRRINSTDTVSKKNRST